MAGELQRYLKQLSGAELPIVASDKVPAQKPLIVVGGPQSNPLAAAAQEKQLVHFAGLKPDGFVLKRIELEGVPVLLAGGNDETGTMYAAYELLERLGIVFQLTNDIIPQQKPDLALPALDVRMEPVFKHRGMHCCHGIRWYMGLADFRQEIDQLAKLKLNVLPVLLGHGRTVGRVLLRRQEGGDHLSQGVRLLRLGLEQRNREECEGRPGVFSARRYLGPPEFAKVQTPQQAYSTARDFLREVIRYAHQRKVQVWLALGEMTYVPPNLVPPPAKRLGFGPFYCGIAIPHGEPAMLDIWEAAVRSMIETYPEADRYWVCHRIGSPYRGR